MATHGDTDDMSTKDEKLLGVVIGRLRTVLLTILINCTTLLTIIFYYTTRLLDYTTQRTFRPRTRSMRSFLGSSRGASGLYVHTTLLYDTSRLLGYTTTRLYYTEGMPTEDEKLLGVVVGLIMHRALGCVLCGCIRRQKNKRQRHAPHATQHTPHAARTALWLAPGWQTTCTCTPAVRGCCASGAEPTPRSAAGASIST